MRPCPFCGLPDGFHDDRAHRVCRDQVPLVLELRRRAREMDALRASGGVVLTEDIIELLAAKAEAGYDPAILTPKERK